MVVNIVSHVFLEALLLKKKKKFFLTYPVLNAFLLDNVLDKLITIKVKKQILTL